MCIFLTQILFCYGFCECIFSLMRKLFSPVLGDETRRQPSRCDLNSVRFVLDSDPMKRNTISISIQMAVENDNTRLKEVPITHGVKNF